MRASPAPATGVQPDATTVGVSGDSGTLVTDHADVRSAPGRSGRPEQPVGVEVEPREGPPVGVVTGPPRLGQRAGEVVLLGEEVGGPVAHAPGLDEEHLGAGRQQVGEEALVGREPRQPGLHAVEDQALGEPLPLLATPGLVAHQLGRPGPDVGRGQQLPRREDGRLVEVGGGALVVDREVG